MKILYTGTLDVNAGGPAFSTYNTMRGLNGAGVETHVLMNEMGEGGKLIGTDVPMHFAKKPMEHVFGYSPSYKKEIRACGEFDVYQAQGIWQYNTYALVDVARSKGKPYLITPRGMLYPQDIAKSKAWFKKMSLKIRLLDDLNRAACVHVTCDDEMRHCRDLGVTSPVAIVPNPVEIKEYPSCKKDDVFRLGYLGRISRRKNVEGLIYAWAALGEKAKGNAELLIIGGGDEEYMAFLKAEVARLKLQNVRFTGFISGKEKEEALASLSVLAMPSEFENFGNVIVEGLVRGIPCIATTGAPWKDLVDYRCGWWVNYSQDDLTSAVRSAMETTTEELFAMGERGKALMKDKYSIEAVAQQMKAVYEWIVNHADQPAFVHLVKTHRGVIWIELRANTDDRGTKNIYLTYDYGTTNSTNQTNCRLFGEVSVRPRNSRKERNILAGLLSNTDTTDLTDVFTVLAFREFRAFRGLKNKTLWLKEYPCYPCNPCSKEKEYQCSENRASWSREAERRAA